MANPAIAGKRVRLKPVRDENAADIDSWYEEAARAAYEGRSLGDLLDSTRAPEPGLLAISERQGDEPIGLIEYRRERQLLAMPFVALAKAHRGWGYGSEAVRLLEGWALRERIAERFQAGVDVRNGLGLYFWLRLGYRPEAASAGDGRDVMTLVREVETGDG